MAQFTNDTFTDTNGTLLQNHTADDGGSWSQSATWSADSEIQGNELQGPENADSAYAHSGSPSSAEYDVECDSVFNADNPPSINAGQLGRYDGNATGYHVRYEPANDRYRLFKVSSGSFTELGVYNHSRNTGTERVNLELRDAAKKVYIDGGEQISSSNDDITSVGSAGLRYSNPTGDMSQHRLDDFTATDAATTQVVPIHQMVNSGLFSNAGI